MISYQCTSCGKQHQAADDLAGRIGKCGCGAKLRIPEPIRPSQQKKGADGPVEFVETHEPELRYEAKMVEHLKSIDERLSKGSPGGTGFAFGFGLLALLSGHAVLTADLIAWGSRYFPGALLVLLFGAVMVADALHKMLGGRR